MRDGDALSEICRRLGPAIYRRCLKILRNPDEAADACQKVYMQLVRHRSRLPPEPEQLRWVYVVATRVCFAQLRDDAWETASGAELNHDAPAPTDSFAEVADRQMALKALSCATEHERMVAWLVLVDGHSQEEAAELLSLSRKTVGKRIQLFLANARRGVFE